MRRGTAAVLLLVVLVWFLAWDLRAVLLDNRPGATDTTLDDLLTLLDKVAEEGAATGLPRWFVEARKGPLAGALTAAAYLVVDHPLLAPRSLGVLLHIVALLLVHALARRMTGSRASALTAVVIAGTFAGQYGWFRSDSHEGPLTVLTLAAVLLLSSSLRRWRVALLMGLVGGLGMLAKPAFPVFVVWPALVMLVWTVRDRGAVARVALSGVLAIGLWALWLVPNLSWMSRYAAESSNVVQLSEKIDIYLTAIPPMVPLYLAAFLATLLALLRRSVPVFRLVVLATATFGGLGVLLRFDPWVRYQVPAFSLCAVLVGVGLHTAAQWARDAGWSRFCRRATAVLLLALLVVYTRDNLVGLPHPEGNREWGAGLVKPDTRPYRAFPDALEFLASRRLTGYYVYGWPPERDLVPLDVNRMWMVLGYRLPMPSPDELVERLRNGERLYLVYVHPMGGRMPTCVSGQAPTKPAASGRRYTVVDALVTTHLKDSFTSELREVLRTCSLRIMRCWANPDGQRVAVIEAHRSNASKT